jgi:hypothetical protein
VVFLLLGCGEPDESISPDDSESDGSTEPGQDQPIRTHVTGVFEGTSFELTFARSLRQPENRVVGFCVTGTPTDAEACGYNDQNQNKFLLVGYFTYRTDTGEPNWWIAELWRHGTKPEAELSVRGPLTVHEDDPESGRLVVSFELEFTSGVTSGSVVYP